MGRCSYDLLKNADIKSGAVWGAPYDIPAKITPSFLNAFVKEVKKRHAECL